MKITFPRDQMLPAFAIAASVAPQKSPKAILQSIKLEAHGEHAVLTATDLELGVRIELPGVQVDSPGSCLLPVSRFMAILRESSDSLLRIQADQQSTVVKGDRSQFRLSGANADEFPPLTARREDRGHVLPARLFRELIRRTVFATEQESSRYALGGVLLEFERESIVAVGTDGRRLAKMEGPATSVGAHLSGDSTTIVPARAMTLMERAFTDPEEKVNITAHANDLLVHGSRVSIYARLVEGRFPRWRDVFPSQRDSTRIEMAVGPLHEALRQASIVVSEESRGVDFTFGDGMLVLSAETAEVGQSRIELPVSYTGPAITVSMDPRYVVDFLKVLSPEATFTLDLQDSEAAALFLTADGFGYVVMPMSRDRG